MIDKEIIHFRNLRDFVMMSIPIIVSYSSETMMMFVDRLFLANYSPLEGEAYISASLIGALSSFMIYGIFVTTAGYTNALVSQFVGAGKKHFAAIITCQTLYLVIAVYPLMFLISFFIDDFFSLFDHSPLQTHLESVYTQIMLWGCFLIIIRSGLSGFFIGIGKTRIVMIANVAGMLINIPLNYVLIHGFGYFPELGIIGAALATNIAILTALLILLGEYFRETYRREYQTGKHFAFHPQFFRKLLYYGFPSGVELFFGLGAFTYFIMVMSNYGPAVGAAVTIAINWDSISFIPMLGINNATTAMMGRYMGAQDLKAAKNIVFLSLFITGIYAMGIGIVFNIFPHYLVAIFLKDMAQPQLVGELSIQFIRLIAIYVVADAVHICLEGALKGAGDTRAVMLIFVSIAVVFASIIYVTAGAQRVEPITAWFIFIAYAVSLGIGMLIRFKQGKWKSIDMVGLT